MRLEDLSGTITKAYDLKGINISQGDADATAETVLSYFGYGDYCLSNSLEADVLSLFYELEEMGIIKTYSENENLNIGSGMVWRVIQFQLDHQGMERINQTPKENGIRHEASIYDELPDSAFVSPEINALENGKEEQMKLNEIKIEKEEMKVEIERVRKMQCRECREQFLTKPELMRHMRSHPFDDGKLDLLQKEGKTLEEISVIMKRSKGAIKDRIRRHSSPDFRAGGSKPKIQKDIEKAGPDERERIIAALSGQCLESGSRKAIDTPSTEHKDPSDFTREDEKIKEHVQEILRPVEDPEEPEWEKIMDLQVSSSEHRIAETAVERIMRDSLFRAGKISVIYEKQGTTKRITVEVQA